MVICGQFNFRFDEHVSQEHENPEDYNHGNEFRIHWIPHFGAVWLEFVDWTSSLSCALEHLFWTRLRVPESGFRMDL